MKTSICLLLISVSILFSQNNKTEQKSRISESALISHIKTLGSDKFLGRAPGHEGEEVTIKYLVEQYKKIGLVPLDGKDYLQMIDVTELTPKVTPNISFTRGGKSASLHYGTDFVAITRREAEKVIVEPTEIIFAGYGIDAPEYGWNDFDGIDVKDKILIVMVNDPGYGSGDPKLFNGKSMTYYGRWTYKYEEAARKGAAGIFIIHETGAASYPWEVVKNGRVAPQYFIKEANKNMSRCKFEGWITYQKAGEIFTLAGLNLESELKNAATPGFKSKPLGIKTSLQIENKIQQIKTSNVLGVLPGTTQADEYIFYMAHWDHLGIDNLLTGDKIFNGARDNATGVGAILEIGKAFSNLKEKPKRSIVIFSVAGEEQGLIGSEYYSNYPIVPLNKTVAVINLDGLNIFGKTKDMALMGYGLSELDNYVKEEAAKRNIEIIPDPNAESGGYFRSDHYNFAKVGVPAVYMRHGEKALDPSVDISNLAMEWNRKHYHKVTDEYRSSWNLGGMLDEIEMLFNIGLKLSNETTFPKWSTDTRYYEIREKSFKK